MKNFPEMETARLRLRPLTPDDLEAMHRLWNDPDMRRFLWDDQPVARERAEAVLIVSRECFEKHGFGLWGLVHKENEALIGFSGFRFLDDTPEIEILYGVAAPYGNQGLATEAVRANLRYGFEDRAWDRIVGIANPQNTASWRVMEKAGMTHAKSGRYRHEDVVYYAIARAAFRPDDSLYILRRG